jgi:hypothetical protein
VQLVSARRDEMLWSDRYDRDLEDILALQSDVAGAVAREIAVLVTPVEARQLARRQEVNAEAHLEYLKGKHNAEATSPQAIDLSLQHFQRALELDPGYAPAWAGVAGCHHTRAARGMAARRRAPRSERPWNSTIPWPTPTQCSAGSSPTNGICRQPSGRCRRRSN